MTDLAALEALARESARMTIRRIVRDGVPLLVVDSPPGAGKTWLVEQVVAVAACQAHARVCVATPRAEQAYDLLRRLLAFRLPRLEAFMAGHRTLPSELVGRVPWVEKAGNLGGGPGVVVTTAHKLAANLDGLGVSPFDILIVDEAYQLAAKDFYAVADLAGQVLLVGDPGQLDPLISTDTAWFEAQEFKVHWPVPKAILDRHPSTEVIRLPATRRLPSDTTTIVQPAFYPDLPFGSLVDDATRGVRFQVGGIAGIDRALNLIDDGATMVAILLPPRRAGFEEFDDEVAGLMARVVERLMARQGRMADGELMGEGDIGCIDPHVASGEAISGRLRAAGVHGIDVNTPEQWQGRQTAVTVVKHPLTEIADLSTFNLDAGRWCVTLSRHTHACIMVGRASIENQLDEYIHRCGETPSGARDELWRGYRAHATVWRKLQARGRLIRL